MISPIFQIKSLGGQSTQIFTVTFTYAIIFTLFSKNYRGNMLEDKPQVDEVALDDLIIEEFCNILHTRPGKQMFFIFLPILIFNSICSIIRFLS